MNSFSVGPQAVEDFVTVQKAVSSPHIKSLQESILSGTATESGIIEHYRTFDAIDSQTVYKNERAAYLQIQALGRVALADFIGGAQMISSALMGGIITNNGGYEGVLPRVFDENGLILAQHQYDKGNIDDVDVENWNSIADYSVASKKGPMTHLAERVGLLHYARLTGVFDSNVVARSTDTLKSLSIGKAIMAEGTKNFRHYIDLQRAPILPTDTDVDIANKLVEVAESPQLQLGLSDLILRSGSLIESDEAKDIVLNETKNRFGPMLSWPTSANALHTTRYQGEYYKVEVSMFRKMQEASFGDVLHNLRTLTKFAREKDPNMFQKGRIKGSLHEVLWMLDAYVIRKSMPENFGGWTVDVATEAEDYPFVGGPAMKRGFDFVVKDEINGLKRRLIQVGASPRKSKNKTELPYHPGIEVYCEKEFNEVNLTTLENKLTVYEKWAKGGFTTLDYDRMKISNLLLGTVKECFGVKL